MNPSTNNYSHDLLIVGGGLAGLAMAILAGREGFKVALFERQSYPKHKVCGEYISNESRDFLISLGVPIDRLQLPEISEFVLTTAEGVSGVCNLAPGGFGISRYTLDHLLSEQALAVGAEVMTNTHVASISGDIHSGFSISTAGQTYSAPLALAAWGRSGGTADQKSEKGKEAWIGVKYHVDAGPEKHKIEIHAFHGGYAGISKVEGEKWCLCYLVQASAMKPFGGNISAFEQSVLVSNPALAKRLMAHVLEGPVTTSLFQFGAKTQDKILRLGDAAGFIPPLTGNGMSLALRSAHNMFIPIKGFLRGEISVGQFVESQKIQHRYLHWRIKRGVWLQRLLLIRPLWLNKLLMYLFTLHPIMLKKMTSLAVGKTIQ